VTALFNRVLFNNKTIPSINGFTNMRRMSFMDMSEFNTWVKMWSRGYGGLTIGCEIYVCDSVFVGTATYSGQTYRRPTILRCSLWLSSESKDEPINFKLCSSYGQRLINAKESFEEFKNVTVEMTKVIREHL